MGVCVYTRGHMFACMHTYVCACVRSSVGANVNVCSLYIGSLFHRHGLALCCFIYFLKFAVYEYWAVIAAGDIKVPIANRRSQKCSD